MDQRTAPLLALVAALLLPSAALAGPDCQCRSAGQFFNQGDLACIRTNQGLKLARCEMSQNVTTWTVVGDSCPQTLMTPLPPGSLTRALAFAMTGDADLGRN